jgi:hypothetical protein
MYIIEILKILVAMGLLNVWILRYNKKTNYRGGNANNLKEEFAAYGLSPWVYYLVGALKIFCALALITSIWIPSINFLVSLIIIFLMIGALVMHMKIKDPLKKIFSCFFYLNNESYYNFK